MKRQFRYTVITGYYENGDMGKPRRMRMAVRASDEDRAGLAARQHTQRKLYQRDELTALDDITVVKITL